MKMQAILRAFLFLAFAATLCNGAERHEAVVKIGGCSGVSISDSGIILTAKHCRLKNYLTVEWPSGRKSRAVQLVRSRNGDGPTVFLCEGNGHPWQPVAKTPPKVGDQVESFGYPAGRGGDRSLTHSVGTVTGRSKATLQGNPFKITVATNHGAPGWSGGPLLNERGEVVGLLTGGGKEPDGSWESIWITHEAVTHAVNVAQPIADDLIIRYSRASQAKPCDLVTLDGSPEVVIFVTPNCAPCQRLKRDVAADSFSKYQITFVTFDPQLGTFDRPDLEREFRTEAKPPTDDLYFPLVWVRGTDRYKVGYEAKPLGGVLGFLEGVINLGERIIVGPKPKPTPFPGGTPPPPDGEPSVEISEPVQVALGSVERLKQQVADLKANAGELKSNAATLREAVDNLKNGNPIEKAKAVLPLKKEVAELKTNAGELRGTVRDVRRDVDGDPLNYLLGLLPGLLTGLFHRRFAH